VIDLKFNYTGKFKSKFPNLPLPFIGDIITLVQKIIPKRIPLGEF